MRSGVVCLGGFMCSGKSSVGRELSLRLRREFLDTDSMIEKNTGLSVAEIFTLLGEAEFRRMEREAVLEALDGSDRVVSLGGGALLDDGSRSAVLERAFLVILDVRPETVLERAASGGRSARPLLGEGVRALMESRSEAYSSCHLRISTDDLPVGVVADLIVKGLPSPLG